MAFEKQRIITERGSPYSDEMKKKETVRALNAIANSDSFIVLYHEKNGEGGGAISVFEGVKDMMILGISCGAMERELLEATQEILEKGGEML